MVRLSKESICHTILRVSLINNCIIQYEIESTSIDANALIGSFWLFLLASELVLDAKDEKSAK